VQAWALVPESATMTLILLGSAVKASAGRTILSLTGFDVDVIAGGCLMRVMEGNTCGDAATRVLGALGRPSIWSPVQPASRTAARPRGHQANGTSMTSISSPVSCMSVANHAMRQRDTSALSGTIHLT
jgi:hypothetical protein